MLSMRTKYALLALCHMARRRGRETFQIGEIAEAEGIPKKFLEAILLALKGQGVLASRKGPGGGYWLARQPEEITLGMVIRTFEGDPAPLPCLAEGGSGCPECPDPPLCDARIGLEELATTIREVIDRTTLEQIVTRSDERRQTLQRQIDFAI